MSKLRPFALTALLAAGTFAAAMPLPETAPPAAPADLAAPAGAATTASGLATQVLTAGDGKTHPKPKDFVTIHYSGWTRDGKLFDSTASKDGPSTVFLQRLMKGMAEGIQLMTEGETRRMWIPEALGFAGMKGRPAGDLVLDVQLLATDPPPSQAPEDLALPPASAVHLPSGLIYRVLRPGKGSQHPSRRSTVTVHYTGWTLDGQVFDSTLLRNETASLRLDGVIQGWTEGLQLMPKGAKYRFWVPEKLAYHGERGKPAGMLVFDISLQEFWQ